MSDKVDKEWFKTNFPNANARDAADRAIDAIDANEPMPKFIDAWIAAYTKAGGKRGQR